MDLLFLGTGGSWPCKEYNVPALALKYNSEIILFDCGEGTQRQFMMSKFSFMQVNKIFISHYHGDHFLGLPGLIQSMNLNDRTDDLEIYGPKGTIKIVGTLLQLGYFAPSFKIKLFDLDDSDKLVFEHYDITAFAVDHGVPGFGYVLEERSRPGKFSLSKAKKLGIPKGPMYRRLQSGDQIELNGRVIKPDQVLGKPRLGRKFVYSGDTRPCETLVKHAKNADVLVHDACLDSSLEEKALNYGHSTAQQAAQVAKDANVKTLFLIHHSPRYKDVSVLEKEAKAVFKSSIVATDFMEHTIKFSKK
jgi:ribonuclease Z